jgi:ribosome-binding factor A
MADHRRERVEHLLRARLATLLLTEAKDRRLATVAVSAVRMTPDLRQARIFYRTLGPDAERPAIEQALARATPFLRAVLGRSLDLRVTPALVFEYDTTPDTARRVDDLLRGAAQDADDEDDE